MRRAEVGPFFPRLLLGGQPPAQGEAETTVEGQRHFFASFTVVRSTRAF